MGRSGYVVAGIIILALLVGLMITSGFVTEWLWYQSMRALEVFWVQVLTGPLVKLILGLLVFGFLVLNFLPALAQSESVVPEQLGFTRKSLFLGVLAAAAVLSLFTATGLSLDWGIVMPYLNRTDTGLVDPIFNKDAGFYLFTYPFYRQINSLILNIIMLALVGTSLIYFASVIFQHTRWGIKKSARLHLSILVLLFAFIKIWNYSLAKYGLIFQEGSILTGVDYTAHHARIFAYNALSWLLAPLALLLVAGLFRGAKKLFVAAPLAWIACSFALGVLYPALVQSFKVSPDEYELEKKYLGYHIRFTRLAYNLDKIETSAYKPLDNAGVLNPGDPALADLRLWDYRPLLPTYNQLQSIRPYYHFSDIDIDRYQSSAGQRQVLISPRELNVENLSSQAKNWINLHLTYTHGYGMAANEVSRFSPQGQPIFIARDLPPKTDPDFASLHVTDPAIYFGELTNQYIIVNSKMKEFDYPQGERNKTTVYRGTKGIPLDSYLNKIMLAFGLGEPKFLLSPLLVKGSSVLMHRNIRTRLNKLAPFLMFDKDPYLVASGGKFYWLVDGYTVHTFFPYSKTYTGGYNYMRNAVKAVVDAYSGEVRFYVADEKDPVLKVWRKVFPRLFTPLDKIAPDLMRHFRYPEDFFKVQRDMLVQYHMTSPRTFYEKEDYWEIPAENQYGGEFEPYYVTLRLPGERNPEFAMMQPFSPRGKQNLVSWLIARCDQPNYGRLILYVLPKDQNIYGPVQVDGRIIQDETISELITLWGQQQSKVIWGNLLIVPIEGSILYIKSLYIGAESGQQVELKKVVLIYQNQVLLGNTVADALSKFSPRTPSQPGGEPGDTKPKVGLDRKSEILQKIEANMRRIDELLKDQRDLWEQLRGL
ncbi:MAG: UPF0182 family protein [Bacillota bacterium]